eukprot:sb/3477632/
MVTAPLPAARSTANEAPEEPTPTHVPHIFSGMSSLPIGCILYGLLCLTRRYFGRDAWDEKPRKPLIRSNSDSSIDSVPEHMLQITQPRHDTKKLREQRGRERELVR